MAKEVVAISLRKQRIMKNCRLGLIVAAVLVSALLIASCGILALAAEIPSRPNILYIMADDHAAHAISAYSGRINKTPNLDRLAREGMRLDACFCVNSICTPSRACILTGKYSHKNGVPVFNRFDGSQPTLAKYLQAAGYHTGHDRQVAPRQRADRLRRVVGPAGPGRLSQPGLHRGRRPPEDPGLRYRHHHRSLDRIPQEPAQG